MAKKKASEKRLCLPSGYAYELDEDGKRKGWRKCPSDDWEIVVTGSEPVEVLGRREIDGSECIVCRITSGSERGKIMAVTAIAFGKGGC